MLSFTVSQSGADKVTETLNRVAAGLESLEPQLRDAGDYLMDFLSKDVFASEGADYGSPWQPLSPRYAAQKAKKWGSRGLLVASGKMKNSYRLYTSSDYLLIRNEATNAAGDYYARAHQDGVGRMPQRLLIKFDQERMSRVVQILSNGIAQKIAGEM